MIFRRNPNEAIDRQIKETMLKPLTAESLNYMSDLYLRKGEKELAIECLYNAIAKLHVSQRDKMIAMYKKIIKLAPGDDKAYRGLIDIFAKMGLVAEEVNHLILFAKVYQSRGDYEKANELYRRIHLIDPDNETAAKYFGKGKQSSSGEAETDSAGAFGEDIEILSAHPEIGDLTGFEPSGGPEELQQAIWTEAQGKEIPGVDTADDVPADKESWDAMDIPQVGLKKRVYLIMGIAVVLILVVAAGFLGYRKMRGEPHSTVRQAETPAVSPGFVGTKHESGDIRISALRVTADEPALVRAVGRQAAGAHQFYAVSLQAAKGCIPEQFVIAPLAGIFFVGSKEEKTVTTPVKGQEQLTRKIYKAVVPGCGENAAVFMKIFVAHPQGQQYKGIAVQMREKGGMETVTWE